MQNVKIGVGEFLIVFDFSFYSFLELNLDIYGFSQFSKLSIIFQMRLLIAPEKIFETLTFKGFYLLERVNYENTWFRFF